MDKLLALSPSISYNLSRAITYPTRAPINTIPKDVAVYRVLGIEGLYISTYNFFLGEEIDSELAFYQFECRKFWFNGHIPLKILEDSDTDYLISYFKMKYRQMYRRYQNK